MFVFITENLWRIFWHDKWRSVFDVVQNFRYWNQNLISEDNVCNGGKIVDCSSILRPCKKIDYLFGVDESDIEHEEDEEDSNETSQLTKVDISLQNELVTYVEEYYTYDWQSFIGEVGGTFGLFLGVSMLTTIFDLIELMHRIFKCWLI